MTVRRSVVPSCLFVCLALLPVTACRHGAPGSSSPAALAQFRAAVEDAEVATSEEIFRELWAVGAEERGLRWQGAPGASPLLVLTWTQWDGYDDLVGKETSVSRPVWVTLVPELQELCRHHYPRRRGALTRRLEELLGLPPASGKNRFVELWVEAEDLLRPCPDKEITDKECSLDFPPTESADSEYRRWFEEQKAASYGDDGYPWTRLGYSYDWGNPTSVVGASEYLIWPEAQVRVHSVSKLSRYCRP